VTQNTIKPTIIDTEHYNTNKSRRYCWKVKDCSLFPLQTPHHCRNPDCHRLPPVIRIMSGGKVCYNCPEVSKIPGVQSYWWTALL